MKLTPPITLSNISQFVINAGYDSKTSWQWMDDYNLIRLLVFHESEEYAELRIDIKEKKLILYVTHKWALPLILLLEERFDLIW